MTFVHSFSPLADRKATKLILGSMPGKASLMALQYYAHPRNAFWQIMESLFGIPRALPYPARCQRLLGRKIAVWDVLKACTRSGSLDSATEEASIEANDLGGFLQTHPAIAAIYFNGAKAEQCYRRYVLPHLAPAQAGIEIHRLPSTSPAHAAMSAAQKLRAWRAIAR